MPRYLISACVAKATDSAGLPCVRCKRASASYVRHLVEPKPLKSNDPEAKATAVTRFTSAVSDVTWFSPKAVIR